MASNLGTLARTHFLLRCCRWVLLGAVPMMMLRAIQTYVSMELSPIPLFWVLPLTFYLVSWVIVIPTTLFLRPAALAVHRWLTLLEAVYITVAVFFLCMPNILDVYQSLALLLGVCSVTTLVCHGELLKDCRLTVRTVPVTACAMIGILAGQYLLNSVLPRFSPTLDYDLPIILVLACLARPVASFRALWSRIDPSVQNWRSFAADILVPIILGWLTWLLICLSGPRGQPPRGEWLSPTLLFGVTVGCCFLLCARPLRFGLAVAIMFVLHFGFIEPRSEEERKGTDSYFGVLRVTKGEGSEKTPKIDDLFKGLMQKNNDRGIGFENQPDQFLTKYDWFPRVDNRALEASQAAAFVGFAAVREPLPLVGASAMRLRH